MLDYSEQTDIFMNSFLIQDTEEMQNVIINLEVTPIICGCLYTGGKC